MLRHDLVQPVRRDLPIGIERGAEERLVPLPFDDEAVEAARLAVKDIESFRSYAKATGVDVVKVETKAEPVRDGWIKAVYFAAGAITGFSGCFILLSSLGVI